MAIITTWSSFRDTAAIRVVTSPTALFANDNPDTITRVDGGGDFVANGVEAGMVGIVTGSVSNDNRKYHVESLTTTIITLRSDDVVVVEGPVSPTITFHKEDPDGVEQFPGALADTNLVRAGGFDGGITGTPTPFANATFYPTANSEAADGAPDVDEYDWYLSQKTDDPAKQWLSIDRHVVLVGGVPDGNSYSGTVDIFVTAQGVSELGIGGSVTMEQTIQLFTHANLYCRRISDGAIQWLDLLNETMST